jgi:phage terminase small subunit
VSRVQHGHLPEVQQRKGRSFYVPSLNSMTPQQQVFADEYLIDLNPKEAAIRAGFPSLKAAYAATMMMKHAPVREHIAKALAARSKRVGLTADRVLQRLGAIVNGDPRAIFNENGGLKPPHQMNADDALMLAGVKTRKAITQDITADGKMIMVPEEITEIKVVDTLAALALAMRHLGMMNDKLDINVTHNLHDRLLAAQNRIKKSRGALVIDGEFEEDMSAALAELEQQADVLQQEIVEEVCSLPAPQLQLEDLWK